MANTQAIQTIQHWLCTQPHIPKMKDELILSFLHAAYYCTEKAQKMIDRHFTIRTNTPEVFQDRKLEDPRLYKQLQIMHMAILPKNTTEGFIVSTGRLFSPNAADYHFDLDLKLVVMMSELMIMQQPTCPGHVLILDASGLSMAHLLRVNFGTVRKVIPYLQEGLNLRLKEVHIINITPIIDYVMMLLRPLLRGEILSLLHFHSGRMEEFYRKFPREMLPAEYGGKVSSLQELHATTMEMLTSNQDHFLQYEKLVIDNTKRPSAHSNSTTSSIRLLNID